MRLQRIPQRVSNCLSPFSSHFTCPQGQHYRVWCWLLVALLLAQGSASLKNLTRLMPTSVRYWAVLRMVKAGYWDASALIDEMALAVFATLPPSTDRIISLIGDKTTKEKSGKQMPLAHKTRMNEFAPYVFGLDPVLLIAQWGRFRVPVACALIDPKIKGHQNILFRQMLALGSGSNVQRTQIRPAPGTDAGDQRKGASQSAPSACRSWLTCCCGYTAKSLIPIKASRSSVSSIVFAKKRGKRDLIVLMPIGAKDSINTGRLRDCNTSTRHFSVLSHDRN